MNHPTLRRILAIDAFRGLTLAFMIIVNMPGSWAKAYQPLKHANWHGCTPTDLVFPFFLFVVGISMRYSFEKYDKLWEVNHDPNEKKVKLKKNCINNPDYLKIDNEEKLTIEFNEDFLIEKSSKIKGKCLINLN